MSKDILVNNALAEVAGPFKDFAEKIGGSEGQLWMSAFKKFLRKENPWPMFQIWRTIKLGTGLKNADAFLKALDTNGCKASDWGKDILSKPAFKAAKKKTEVDLVSLSVAELGFKDGATIKDIYERAKSFGLELCPNEVGPQLRLQYKDQPKGEWLLVAMEPITGSDGSLGVFRVAHVGDALWLHAFYGYPGCFYFGGNRFLFVLPRKSS